MQGATRGRFIDLESPRGYVVDYSRSAERWREPELPGDPSVLARVALGDLELYLARGTPERRDRFSEASRWLVSHLETIPGGFGGWPMPTTPEAYREELAVGWFSGRAHAECVGVLLRAGTILGSREALEAARVALGGFETPVDDGGFIREVAERGLESGLDTPVFVETYPTARPSLELLGQTTAMFALHDAGRVLERERAAHLLDRAVRGLEYVLDRFDTGAWSRADLDDRWRGARIAVPARHREHILHLKEVARVTGHRTFNEMARRWGEYDARPLAVLRARIGHMAFRMMNPGAPEDGWRG